MQNAIGWQVNGSQIIGTVNSSKNWSNLSFSFILIWTISQLWSNLFVDPKVIIDIDWWPFGSNWRKFCTLVVTYDLWLPASKTARTSKEDWGRQGLYTTAWAVYNNAVLLRSSYIEVMVAGGAKNGVASGSRWEELGLRTVEELAAGSGLPSLPGVFKHMLKWGLPPHFGHLDLNSCWCNPFSNRWNTGQMISKFVSWHQLLSWWYMHQKNELAGNNYNVVWKLWIAGQLLCAGLELAWLITISGTGCGSLSRF